MLAGQRVMTTNKIKEVLRQEIMHIQAVDFMVRCSGCILWTIDRAAVLMNCKV